MGLQVYYFDTLIYFHTLCSLGGCAVSPEPSLRFVWYVLASQVLEQILFLCWDLNFGKMLKNVLSENLVIIQCCLYFQVQMTKDYDWLQVHLNRKTWCNNVATIGMVGIFFRLYRSPAEYKMRPYS